MFYVGRNNKVYRKYARYRDWLYKVDDAVRAVLDVSLFDLVSMSILGTWYAEGINSFEAATYVIVKGVL